MIAGLWQGQGYDRTWVLLGQLSRRRQRIVLNELAGGTERCIYRQGDSSGAV